MNEQVKTVGGYVGDLLAVERHCAQAMHEQLDSSFIKKSPDAEGAVRAAHAALASQISDLERRLEELDTGGKWKESLTKVTGFLAGVYDSLRAESLSRALRDDLVALHFIHVCQTMLITTAGCLGDADTEELVRGHQRAIPPLTMRVFDCLPGVVVRDLEAQGGAVIEFKAAQRALESAQKSWQTASNASG